MDAYSYHVSGSVIRNGYQFPGHWSWIYVARNDPATHGTRIWQWMARQHL